MRNIFLHIGCGKTGSSALQIWLWNNSKNLKNAGINYPIYGKEKIERYSITSGNGLRLISAFKDNVEEKVIENDLSNNNLDLLYSSEAFQSLTNENILSLAKIAKKNNVKIQVIAFVRNVYDIAYSSYLQQIKRHLCSERFKDFALSRPTLQQFHVIKKYEQFFDDIHLIHYDSAKNDGIDQAFCEKMGINTSVIDRMENTIVNRSLDLFESEILRISNKEYKRVYPDSTDTRFSEIISDALIYSNPEKKTKILFDKDVVDFFKQTLNQEVERLNKKYFHNNCLKIFDPENKESLPSIIPEIPVEYVTVIKSLIKIGSTTFENPLEKDNKKKLNEQSKSKKLEDPDILREAALILEKKGKHDIAKEIINQAIILRPQGEAIKSIHERLHKKNH